MKVYGPYTRKKDGRQHVCIIKADGSRTTKSYPKYLVEQRLGRLLDRDAETIDHTDSNPLNNAPSNIVLRDRVSHSQLDVVRARPVNAVCVWCGTTFQRRANHMRHNSKQGKAGPFCSKRCCGAYGAAVQNNRCETYSVQASPSSEYYKRKDERAPVA